MNNHRFRQIKPLLGAGLFCFALGACNNLSTTQPDPQSTGAIDTSAVITQATPTPAETATVTPEPVKSLAIDTRQFPLSLYYPVAVRLYKGLSEHLDGIEPTDQQRIFLVETERVNLKPSSLMTGDSFSMSFTGQKQEGRCLVEETYRLTTGLTAKAPFFRVIASSNLTFNEADLVLVNKSLDCQRSFSQPGRVTDNNGQPLADVEIRAFLKQRDGQLGYLSKLKSDAQGRFEIAEAPTGVFLRLLASKPNFKSREITFSASLENNGSLNQLELLSVVLEPN